MRVTVLKENVLEWLDQQENGQLYPKLKENDAITQVNVNPVSLEFIIGNLHSPYHIKRGG